MLDRFGESASTLEGARAISEKMLDKIFAAAQPSAVFSPPTVSGEYTVITASSVASGGGFGFGGGSEPAEKTSGADVSVGGGSGGGGGGGVSARPVAVIAVGPDGVKVKPIVDVTRVGLAAMATWASVALMMMRFARKHKG